MRQLEAAKVDGATNANLKPQIFPARQRATTVVNQELLRLYHHIGQQRADQLPWFHSTPIGVAEYQLVRALPELLDTNLPSIEEIEAELSRLPTGQAGEENER